MPRVLERLSATVPKVDDDWTDSDDFREWAAYIRDEVAPKIAESAATVSLVPDESDVKFAVELGLSIMMDKPIVAVVVPGRAIPAKLAGVADRIIEYDDSDPAGTAQRLQAVVSELLSP